MVECKLAKNRQYRRYVVGQVLWYASELWGLPYLTFQERLEKILGSPLAERLAGGGLDPEWDEESFRAATTRSLNDGAFSLVVAVDRIDDELKRIIEYLNSHTLTQTRVLALELDYIAEGETEILVPRLYGEEGVRRKERVQQKHTWSEEELYAALRRKGCSREGV